MDTIARAARDAATGVVEGQNAQATAGLAIGQDIGASGPELPKQALGAVQDIGDFVLDAFREGPPGAEALFGSGPSPAERLRSLIPDIEPSEHFGAQAGRELLGFGLRGRGVRAGIDAFKRGSGALTIGPKVNTFTAQYPRVAQDIKNAAEDATVFAGAALTRPAPEGGTLRDNTENAGFASLLGFFTSKLQRLLPRLGIKFPQEIKPVRPGGALVTRPGTPAPPSNLGPGELRVETTGQARPVEEGFTGMSPAVQFVAQENRTEIRGEETGSVVDQIMTVERRPVAEGQVSHLNQIIVGRPAPGNELGVGDFSMGNQFINEVWGTFKRTRDALRQLHGDTIPLYRGQTGTDSNPDEVVTIWTNRATAERLAQGGPIVRKDVPLDDIVYFDADEAGESYGVINQDKNPHFLVGPASDTELVRRHTENVRERQELIERNRDSIDDGFLALGVDVTPEGRLSTAGLDAEFDAITREQDLRSGIETEDTDLAAVDQDPEPPDVDVSPLQQVGPSETPAQEIGRLQRERQTHTISIDVEDSLSVAMARNRRINELADQLGVPNEGPGEELFRLRAENDAEDSGFGNPIRDARIAQLQAFEDAQIEGPAPAPVPGQLIESAPPVPVEPGDAPALTEAQTFDQMEGFIEEHFGAPETNLTEETGLEIRLSDTGIRAEASRLQELSIGTAGNVPIRAGDTALTTQAPRRAMLDTILRGDPISTEKATGYLELIDNWVQDLRVKQSELFDSDQPVPGELHEFVTLLGKVKGMLKEKIEAVTTPTGGST